MTADFGIVESFNIDDGQLDGLTPQQCFVLGYELADLSRQAELDPAGFGGPVHAINRDRIQAAMYKRNRKCGFAWSGDDKSESWLQLWVAPKD